VPKPGLDRLDVGAIGDEQAGEVVPQIVIAEARREAFNLTAGFSHGALYRPRGQLAPVLARQQSFVLAVSSDLG